LKNRILTSGELAIFPYKSCYFRHFFYLILPKFLLIGIFVVESVWTLKNTIPTKKHQKLPKNFFDHPFVLDLLTVLPLHREAKIAQFPYLLNILRDVSSDSLPLCRALRNM
jgi:hypothetical protein